MGGKTSYLQSGFINTEGAFGPYDGSMYMNPTPHLAGADHSERRRHGHGLATVTVRGWSWISLMHRKSRTARRSRHRLVSHRDVRVHFLGSVRIREAIFRCSSRLTDDASTVATKVNAGIMSTGVRGPTATSLRMDEDFRPGPVRGIFRRWPNFAGESIRPP